MRCCLLVWIAIAGCGESGETTHDREAAESGELRGPRGARAARCDGASEDPPAIDEIMRGADEDLAGAIVRMEVLVGANAGSATARVRLGELFTRSGQESAAQAQAWYGRALEVHEGGCTLAHVDEWLALEGAALSRMMQNDYRGALPFLRRSVERWPSARGTRYNLACALCKTGDVDGCARELERVIRTEGQRGPDFLASRERPAHYFDQVAREDPDLESLRADRERFERIMSAR